MAIFIAIVQGDGDSGYTASFPDFPACWVRASTLDKVIASVRVSLLAHIQNLLEVNQAICTPTVVDEIPRGDALLLAAVEVPDDIGIVHIDFAIPALSLARIDSFAQRLGLTRAALFGEAVRRWEVQVTEFSEERGGMSDGPALSEFGNPMELKVETLVSCVAIEPAIENNEAREPAIQANTDDIAAELARLLEGRSEPETTDGEVKDGRERVIRETG
ncbi:MAG: type II toxin-antitoxin system HicB family antitoxin [Alphaproteobacteria bacterium]|nr:type II toxin-antitoxin system HicB family antitoxin [Alphaproteobacteria bacterium]